MINEPESLQSYCDALAEPFAPEQISWRVGPTNDKSRKPDDALRGQPLIYIDARTVMDRLDAVCGFDNWQNSYTPGMGNSIVCNIGIRVAGEWIWKSDGAGVSDTEPEKGALSDAFKRAAVRWGIGRYLYDIKAPWIDLEKRGNSAIIPERTLPALEKLHEDFAKKVGWGEPTYIASYKLLVEGIEQFVTSKNAVEFEDRNAALIASLPQSMRRNLLSRLGKIAHVE
jgi:hypothetical protein